MDYAARDDLGSIGDPDPITSNDLDYENGIRLIKMATEEFNKYRRNFSGEITFNIDDESKALKT